MAKNNYRNQEKIVKEIEKIKNDFLKKLDDLERQFNKKVQKIIDKNNLKKARKAIK